MKSYKRIFLIVLDSVGAGAMKDAALYGDEGADTLGHIAEAVGGLEIPNLRKLGLANLLKLNDTEPVEKPLGCYAKMAEASVGKDTMTGHWEMMGLQTKEPFLTFTESGFPEDLIREIEKACGKRVIGNISASGTEILKMYGEEELRTGAMIVYTSADSVLQICGHEKSFDLENLYRCCEIVRKLTMKKEWRVGRVIARPYVGDCKENFKRTANRRDYSLEPFGKTVLDALKEAGKDVCAVGKIHDIFSGRGITKSLHSDSSVHGMRQTIDLMEEEFEGLCFTNLVDFDALWGHRRNPEGYAKELEKFDAALGEMLEKLNRDDLLMITADHGNDPTYKGTDHTREYVPFLAYSPMLEKTGRIADRDTFADIGATVLCNFGVKKPLGTIGTPVEEVFRLTNNLEEL